MKIVLAGQIFEKHSSIKFPKNLFIWSRVVLCGQKDKRTDMKTLTVAFLNFAKDPKKWQNLKSSRTYIFQKLALGIT
jgi:hypothetical protein